MKRNLVVALGALVVVIVVVVMGRGGMVVDETKVVPSVVEEESAAPAESLDARAVSLPTERHSAQVDRVKVSFEQWDYTRYRLQTNELVREGEMNSERGFGDDPDATVYILNWQRPEGEQIRYVRLTAEPGYLYVLGSNRNIIKSGRLVLEK